MINDYAKKPTLSGGFTTNVSIGQLLVLWSLYKLGQCSTLWLGLRYW